MKFGAKNIIITSVLPILFVMFLMIFTQIKQSMPHESSAFFVPENIRIVVKKSLRELEVYNGEKLVKKYRIALGFAPVGDKETEGDGKTPEGEFYVFTKNAESKFHLSIGLSYPSIDDAERGFRENLISENERGEIIAAIKNRQMPPQKTKLGGEIYIHGGGIARDWTWGCAALADADITEIFNAVSIGTPVTILP